MFLTIIPMIALCLYKIRFHKGLNQQYLDKDQTGAIKGVFVLMIFLSHVVQYITLENTISDKLFDYIMGTFGQNIVIVFLLYSGYGLGRGICLQGGDVSYLPKMRILRIYLHFVLAILLFWVVDLLVIRGGYSVADYILSLFAWQSVGNSTWFVFVILLCWICTYATFSIFKNKYYALTCLSAILCVYIVLISKVKDGHAWYDTVLCYPLGLVLAFQKERVDAFFHSGLRAVTAILLLGITWVGMRLFIPKNIITFELQSLVFAVFVIALTSRVTVYNKLLAWLGKHSFSIYILQRIPMLLLDHFGVSQWNRFAFILGCTVLTGLLSVGFDAMTDRLDKILKKEAVST